MSGLASSIALPQHLCLHRILLSSAVALTLVAAPVAPSADGGFLEWQAALAKNDNGNGGGHGGGKGNGHGNGRGSNGHGAGHGLDKSGKLVGGGRGHGQAGTAGPHDLHEFLDGVRSGRAFGLERRDERVVAAKERYRDALGKPGRGLGQAERAGTVAYGFSFEETTALIERGWKGPAAQAGFRNHGALQANFGTPFENGIAELQAQLAAAEQDGDEAEAERLRGELAEAIAEAKPGVGPDDSWATADLDVNNDQVVDGRDLEALAQGGDRADQEKLAQQRS